LPQLKQIFFAEDTARQGVVFAEVDLQMVLFVALDNAALFEKFSYALDDFL
jgi:hypothetical protein